MLVFALANARSWRVTLSQQFNIKLPYLSVPLSLACRKQDEGNWRILFRGVIHTAESNAP